MAGLYIHIPFCKSRCIYCGFYSTTLSSTWQDRYVDALCQEMGMRTSPSPSQGGECLTVLSMNGSQADRSSPPLEATGVFRAATEVAAAPQRGANPPFATEGRKGWVSFRYSVTPFLNMLISR